METTNNYQNMDEKALSETLTVMVKELNAKKSSYNELYDNHNKAALEGQKWRDRCVGLEATVKRLCEQKEELIKKCQDSNKESSEPVISKEEYENLFQKNERNENLVWSFFNVLQETYKRIKPLGA